MHLRRRDESCLQVLCEGKQQISKEIPQRGSAHGKHLAEVEIPFQFSVEQIHCQRVDAHANQRNEEIFGVFRPDLRIVALEGPDAVEDVVGGGGNDEAQDVAQVFVPFEPFLAGVGDAKVDEHARKSHDAEFQELQQKFTGQFYFEERGIHRFQIVLQK